VASASGRRFDLETLLARARRAARLEDFGVETFREPLARLLEALDDEARLTRLGRSIAATRVHRHLVNRLRVQEDRRRWPAIGAERIARPLFVIGPPRTGTSILFRTLAQDESTLSPLAWKLQRPSPPPERHAGRLDSRFLATRGIEIFLRVAVPKLAMVYETRAHLPEECVLLKAHEFTTILFSIAYSVPSYDEWLLSCDQTPAYAVHRRLLQQFQWRSGGGRWVLKSPEHLLALDELFATYPDACIVQTHRDPVDLLPSLVSLTRILRSLSTDAIDESRIGREATRFWSAALERAQSFRAAHPELADRFLDVRFEEICADPLAVARRVHERFDLPLTPETDLRMRSFLAANPRGKNGEHRYSLDEFAMDRSEIETRFADYRMPGIEPAFAAAGSAP
jgi:hypothetical protein